MKLSFMKLSIFLLIIFSMSGLNAISADENPKSVCQTVDERSLSKVSLESYNYSDKVNHFPFINKLKMIVFSTL